MKINLVDKNGVTLKTAGTYVEEDIEVGLSESDKSSLVAENIAEGVSVLGVTGTHTGGGEVNIIDLGNTFDFTNLPGGGTEGLYTNTDYSINDFTESTLVKISNGSGVKIVFDYVGDVPLDESGTMVLKMYFASYLEDIFYLQIADGVAMGLGESGIAFNFEQKPLAKEIASYVSDVSGNFISNDQSDFYTDVLTYSVKTDTSTATETAGFIRKLRINGKVYSIFTASFQKPIEFSFDDNPLSSYEISYENDGNNDIDYLMFIDYKNGDLEKHYFRPIYDNDTQLKMTSTDILEVAEPLVVNKKSSRKAYFGSLDSVNASINLLGALEVGKNYIINLLVQPSESSAVLLTIDLSTRTSNTSISSSSIIYTASTTQYMSGVGMVNIGIVWNPNYANVISFTIRNVATDEDLVDIFLPMITWVDVYELPH